MLRLALATVHQGHGGQLPARPLSKQNREPDGGVRFVLKDGTEIHRLPPFDLVYDLDTGKPCGRLDRRGRVLPLLPPIKHPEDLPAKNEVEIEILGD